MIRIFGIGFLLFCGWNLNAKDLTLDERAVVYESYALESKADFQHASTKMASLYDAHKDDYFINLRLGSLLSNAKKFPEALEHYKNAANIAPQALEPWLAMSLLHLNLGDQTNALAAAREILKREPMNYFGLVRTAKALIATQKYAEALVTVETALNVYPVDPTLLEQKGFLLVTTEKAELAKAPLTLLLLISPQNAYAKSILKQ